MKSRVCSVEGCEKKRSRGEWCQMHHYRWKKYGSTEIARPYAPKGTGSITNHGYRVISVAGRKVLEHRKVMEDILGRRLLPGEVVHHIDGDQLNNKPHNLQLMKLGDHSRMHNTKSRTCSIEGCEKKYSARGWCSKHYLRWWKHGDPLVSSKSLNGVTSR